MPNNSKRKVSAETIKLVSSFLFLVGVGMIGYGAYLIHPALGWIFVGLAVVFITALAVNAVMSEERERKAAAPTTSGEVH